MHRVACLALLLWLPGCLVTGTLDPSGGAHLTVRGRLLSMTQFDDLKSTNAQVKLVSSTVDLDRWATYEYQMDDIEQLSSVSLFASTHITFASPDERTRSLTAIWTNPRRLEMTETSQDYFGHEVKVELTVPGSVEHSNATETHGRTLVWTLPARGLLLMPEKTFEAVFSVPGA